MLCYVLTFIEDHLVLCVVGGVIVMVVGVVAKQNKCQTHLNLGYIVVELGLCQFC